MKKLRLTFLIALIVLISISSFSFAQSDTTNIYQWGCSVSINSVEAQIGTPLQSSWGGALASLNVYGDKTEKSLSLSIAPKYLIHKDLFLRFVFGITNLEFVYHNETKNSTYHVKQDETLKQKIYFYQPGVEWRFFKKKRIHLYSGAAICYIHYSDMNFTGYGESYQVPPDTLFSWSSYDITYPGGFAAGIGAFAGINVYLIKHISFGAELSSSLLYYKIGGESSNQQTYQNLPNPPTTSEVTTVSNLYKGFQFSKIHSSFNISLWF